MKGAFSIKKRVNAFDEARFPELKRHFEVVNREIVELIHFEDVRRQFFVVVANSTVKHKDNAFWRVARLSFLHEIIHRIARLAERQWDTTDRQVHSLRAILDQFVDHPEILSRERYTGPKPEREDDPLPPGFSIGWTNRPMSTYRRLDREFDSIAGKSAKFIPKSVVKKDIKTLDNICKKIGFYRNKVLAHNAVNKGSGESFSSQEFAEIIALITGLTRKYFLLFQCSSYEHRMHASSVLLLFKEAWVTLDSQAAIEQEIKLAKDRFDDLITQRRSN